MAKSRIDEALMLKIAMLYYEGGMRQDEIAQKYNKSRPTIVRILQKAREEGLVEIKISKPLPETTRLETDIEAGFSPYGLRSGIVVDTEGTDPKAAVARSAAAYIVDTLKGTDVLGVSYSSTLLSLPDAMEAPRKPPQRLVQLGGGVSFPDSGHTQEIVFRLGRILGAPVESVNAPVLVKNRSVRDGLMDDPNIQSANKWADRCTIAIMGVGTADAESTLVAAGYLDPGDVDAIAAKGAVGDILSHYYDLDGKEIVAPWNNRLVSRSFSQLRKIGNVVLVAAGVEKTKAVLGALRSGIVNTVILDTPLASGLIDQIEPS